ncbi:hypothetical protein RCL1_003832 [Eukaryota sp. TZLM3-RCL]
MLTIPLNSAKYAAIEFPALVKNIDGALQCLGGPEKVKSALADSEAPPLSFRSSSQFPVPLEGDVSSGHSSLFNIVTDDSGNVTSVSHIGHVETTVSYPNMADFQCLPPETPLDDLLDLEDVPLNDIYFPASKYSRVNYIHSFNWDTLLKDVDMTGSVSEVVQELATTTALSVSPSSLSFDYLLSNEAPPQLDPCGRLTSMHSFSKVQELAHSCPIWLRAQIVDLITGPPITQLRAMIAHCFYAITNGPWRRTLCRKGYNPTRDPESRVYQSFDLRSADSLLIKELTGYTPTNNRVIVRLIDIKSEAVAALLAKPPSDTCTKLTGWFTSETWNEIKAELRTLFATEDDVRSDVSSTTNHLSVEKMIPVVKRGLRMVRPDLSRDDVTLEAPKGMDGHFVSSDS